MTLRAALYLRVSLDATGEHLAVDRQRDECRALVASRGWTVVEEYVDNSVSASKRTSRRPAYDRMVEDYAAGHFTALVCWDLDRLTRQPRQLEDWIDAAQERGLLLVTANGEADLSTDGGRLFARIKASVARAEIERKSARQRAAAAQRADLGRVPLGVRLTGYTRTGQVQEREAGTVREVFARFAAGDSLRGIADDLTARGVTARRGGAWSSSSVRTILTNPRYAGRAVYCREATGRPGTWTAIVDAAVFDAVQEQLADPRRVTNREGTDRRHLGSGLYRCGLCGDPIRSHGSRYRCHKGGHLTRIRQSIDELVVGVMMRRLAEPDVMSLLDHRDDQDAARLTDEARRLQGRLGAIEEDYDAGRIDGRRYAVASEKVRASLAAVSAQRHRATGTAALGLVLGSSDPVEAFDSAPLGVRRSVIDTLATVTLHPARRGYKFNPSTVAIEWRTA